MVYPAGTGGFGDEGDIATTTTRRVNHGTLACQPPDRWAASAVAAWSYQPYPEAVAGGPSGAIGQSRRRPRLWACRGG
jgi:hypothetical protein